MPPYKTAKRSTMLPNGRSTKGVPKLENWFAQVFIADHVLVQAWRHLSKNATDILIICIAKQGRAAAFKEKFDGRPVFQFTVSEGTKLLNISRTTFCRAIQELIRVGFIEVVSPGGILNGRGCAADYTIGKAWRTWQPPARDVRNITKARAARKRK